MKTIIASLLVCLMMFIFACRPDALEIDGVPTPSKQVVISSQIIPNQYMTLSVTRNFSALTAGSETNLDSFLTTILVPDLDITISTETDTFALQELTRGIYVADSLPQEAGTTYTLSFANPYYDDTTTAQTSFMPFVGFDKLETTLIADEYDTLLEVDYTITDPEGSNWYMFNVQEVDSSISIDDRPFTELLTDEDFDGITYSGSFTVFYQDFSDNDTVMISVTNISEAYYEFLEIRNDQRYQFISELGEPVNYPTNVVNGLGFFNAHLPDMRIVVLDSLD